VSRALGVVAILSVIVVALQVAWVSPLRVGGVVIMVVWLWPLALGLTGRTSVAVVGGLLAGLLFDAQSLAPFGASALVGVVLALGVGWLAREGVGDLEGSNWLVPALLLGIGGLLAPVIYVAAATVLGRPSVIHASLVGTIAVNGLAFVVLGRPAALLVRRVARIGGWARA
jgi:hypothetical protein